jgi:hypothetical protein
MEFLSPARVKALMISLMVLNVIDAASTHLALKLAFAEELNPLMRWAFETNPVLFWVLKIGLMLLGLWIIARSRGEKLIRWMLVGMNITYLAVLGVHGYIWITYLLK